jgi:SAM-dependent methyltransferase
MNRLKNKIFHKCRLCNSKNLSNVLNFGKVPIGNNYNRNKIISKASKKYLLSLNFCKDCKHCQLSISVNPKILYRTNYTYLSGTAKMFVNHFKQYKTWIIKHTRLKPGSTILDVGSNDGTCLNNFQKNYTVCGIDPAKKPADIANKNNIFTINDYLNVKSKKKILSKFGKFDLITSHNVLAHIDDNISIFHNIYNLLKDNGYFCFEIGYFADVLKKNYFDTIYHEHIDYYSASPLVKFLLKMNFSIINISKNSSQGGSLRILCKKLKVKKVSKQSLMFLIKEKNSNLISLRNLKKWNDRINLQVLKLNQYIQLFKNKTIVGYGAPTKSSLWIKLLKLNSKKISYVVDDNDLKVNKFFPNTEIKILPTKSLTETDIDLLIIFAWNFKKDIISNLKKMKLKNLLVLTPLPTLTINKI